MALLHPQDEACAEAASELGTQALQWQPGLVSEVRGGEVISGSTCLALHHRSSPTIQTRGAGCTGGVYLCLSFLSEISFLLISSPWGKAAHYGFLQKGSSPGPRPRYISTLLASERLGSTGEDLGQPWASFHLGFPFPFFCYFQIKKTSLKRDVTV